MRGPTSLRFLLILQVLAAGPAAAASTQSTTPERAATRNAAASAAGTRSTPPGAATAPERDLASSHAGHELSPSPGRSHLERGLRAKDVPLRRFEAIRAFREALRVDPFLVEALYGLADTYLALDGWEGQREARRALVRILEREPFYRDAFHRWLSLYLYADEHRQVARALESRLAQHFDAREAALAAEIYVQLDDTLALSDLVRRWSSAEEPSRAGVGGDPWPGAVPGRGPTTASGDDGREADPGSAGSAFHYYRARLLFLRGLDAEATEVYSAGLAEVRSRADLELYWRDLEPLLGPDERGSVRGDLAGGARFVRVFWEERDPLPFSPANERLAEQFRRVSEVRRRYPWKKPLAKEKVIGSAIDDLGRASFDTRLEGRSLDDRGTVYLRHGEPDRLFVQVGGAEYWRYDRPAFPGGRLQFHFKRMEGRMGRGNDTVYSILPTTDMGQANVRRGHGGREGVENTILGLTTDTYGFDYGEKVLPLAVSSAAFRNAIDPARTDLLVAAATPLGDVRRAAGGGAATLVERLKVYDPEGEEVAMLSDTLELTERTVEGRRAGAVTAAFRVTSDPGERAYALQVNELASGAVGVARGRLRVRSFAARSFQLSDLLLATRVSAAFEDRSAVQRAGLGVRPLVGGRIPRGRPLHLYYELYDLAADSDGRARWRVEYRIAAEGRVPRSLLERIFGGGTPIREGVDEVAVSLEQERPGPPERVEEALALDLGRVPAGRYRLTVAVRDLVAGREVAEAVVLEVTDPPAEEGDPR